MEGESHGLTGWEPPTLLGSPNLHALDAYRQAVESHFLTPEQSDELRAHIADGIDAAQQLNERQTILDAAQRQALEARIERAANARMTLVVHHLPQVISIARSFGYRTKDEVSDLVASGNVDVISATKNYEPRENIPFSAFIAHVVRTSIIDHVAREQKQTGLTRNMREMLRDIDIAHKAAQKVGDTIGYMGVAEYLGFDKEKVLEALQIRNIKTISLNSYAKAHGTGTTLEEVYEDESTTNQLEEVENKILLDKVWEVAQEMKDKELLTEREWFILVGRFREGMSQRAIGNQLGIEQTNVGQCESKILAKIAQALKHPRTLVLPEITDPREVRLPIHLLALLRIPAPKGADVKALAGDIVKRADLTESQRLILHRLLGTDGEARVSVSHLAEEVGIAITQVSATRNIAVSKILAEHQKDETEEFVDSLIHLGIPVPTSPKDVKTGPNPKKWLFQVATAWYLLARPVG